ncbi:MAG TPA: hypothetical protein V6C69_07895 [Trichormus sp.]|jgi:hypothetical protein
MKISKLKTLLIALAAVISIPGAMAKNGPNSGLPAPHPFVPNLYPFICNLFGPSTPVNGFSGYININGVKGLVIDLQTSESERGQFGLSTVGTFTLPAVPNVRVNAHNRFTGLNFYLQGYCNDDGCSGPWVFVQAYDIHGNPMVGASVVCANNFPGMAGCCNDYSCDTQTFVNQSFNNASFGFPATGVSLAGVTIQLFPGCDGNHDTRLSDLAINGQHAALEQPRTIYNYCPFGFDIDPRTSPCDFSSGSSGGS